MNPHQSNKPFRLKHVSKHVLANIVLSVLVCYLILSVEQLRAGNCSSEITAPLTGLTTQHRDALTHLQQPHTPKQPIQHDTSSQKHSSDQPRINRLGAVARRSRPQPPCVDGKRAKTFLMFFMGHSGSSAIMSELRVHPEVYMEIAELVDHQDVFNTTAALEATRSFFDRGLASGKTPAYKIRPSHILREPEKWRALADEYGTRIIWQYRQNIFKGAVGEYSNRYLNDTSVIEGLRENITKEERCKIGAGCSYPVTNLPFLSALLKNMIRSQQSIVEAVHKISYGREYCVRELPYEDYLYEREASLTDIFKFLGLRHARTRPLRFKATDDNLCNVIENWQDTCNAFYGCTLYQHMIDDPRHNCFCTMRSGNTQYC